jgi:hypothetical protein
MSYPYYDDVTRAHSELQAEGLIGPRTNQDAVEQDKGLVVRRAAYYANQRDPTHGLLAKTSGNNSQGYSVDWILRNTDGEGWDVVTDDGTQALPLNGGPVGADPARIPDWRQPTKELAQISDTAPEPTPPPVEQTDVDDIYAQLEALQTQQAQDTQLVMAHMDANTKQILDTIDSIKTQVEESLQKALALIVIKRNRDDAPVA